MTRFAPGVFPYLFLAGMAGSSFGAEKAIDYESAHLERRLAAKRATGKIVIDGILSEHDWADAPIASHFIQNDPREGEAATYDTEVRFLYDDDNIYFGAVAHDAEPSKIIVNDLKRDFNTRSGDIFGIVLDTFHDERNGFMFETNPAGAKFDAQFVNEGREFNSNWDGVWFVKSRITEDGWVTEIAIPLKTVRFGDQDPQTWGVNFIRRTRRLNEDSYWSPLPRIHRFTRVSLAGTLEGLAGLRSRRDVKVTPYGKGSVNQAAGTSTDGSVDAGVDAKLGIGGSLRLDLTLNTDFSEVEADVQQINLTRFSLFFPEKRVFFLENSGIFRFGPPQDQRNTQFQSSFGASASNLAGGQSRGEDLLFFFSRRIGLTDDGEQIPVVGGGRLTGRVGAFDVGVLNIQTGKADLNEESLAGNGDNFTVARVRRNLFASSDIGVIFINRENMTTGHYNRGIGADANFRLTPAVNVNAYLAKTLTPDLSGDDLAGRVGWTYEGRLFEVQNAYSTLQDNFNPEVGFAPRIGVKRASNYAGYHYRPDWLPQGLREINPHVELEYFTDQKNVVVSRYFNTHVSLQMQNGGFVEVGLNSNLEQPQDSFEIIPDISIPPGFYTFNEWFALMYSDTSRTVAWNVRAGTGDFYSGTKDSISLGGVLKAGRKLSAGADWSYNDIVLKEGRFKTHLLTARFAYNFTTNMFLNALVQYNNLTHEWSSNIRYNFIHRPLSDLFVVYNDLRDETGLPKNRAFIVKYTQLLSF
jgi:Domain of unknown function (DUF5916)